MQSSVPEHCLSLWRNPQFDRLAKPSYGGSAMIGQAVRGWGFLTKHQLENLMKGLHITFVMWGCSWELFFWALQDYISVGADSAAAFLSFLWVLFNCITVFSSHCISRGDRESRVPCHVPPSDVPKGPGSRLQRSCSGDDAGKKKQKPLYSTSLFDSLQASAQSHCCVWSCWREAGGT